MKMIHTADLHLGKRLGKASRLNEQCDVIKEISELALQNDVDVILIAGDIFDATVPPSEAERVFYRAMLTFAENGRAVIALAGNHDDERRLCAAKPLAELQGIVLSGEPDHLSLGEQTFSEPIPPSSLFALADAADYLKKQRIKLIGRQGGVTVVKGEEKVNIALVPYPSESRLSRWSEQDYTVAYEERVKLALENACSFFNEGEYNILCTHLFLTKNEVADTLGGLLAMPVSVLPQNCDYCALGHVHKRYAVCKKPYALYSGSPLQYAYDETRNKSVTLIDTEKKKITELPLTSGRKLTEVSADSYDECMQKLDFYKDDYVRIKYGGEPLGKSEAADIKSHPAFNDLAIVTAVRGDVVKTRRAHLSDEEIFDAYYESRFDRKPKPETRAAFADIMREIKGEEESKNEAD